MIYGSMYLTADPNAAALAMKSAAYVVARSFLFPESITHVSGLVYLAACR